MVAAADGGRWARVLELGREKRVLGRAVGEVAGVSVPFIGPEARERRRSVRELGRQPLMVPFRAGGGNGEGKRGAGEVKGAVVMIHYATGGEGVLQRGGEMAAQSTRRGGSNRDGDSGWMTHGGRR
jgi:hypothetical protein